MSTRALRGSNPGGGPSAPGAFLSSDREHAKGKRVDPIRGGRLSGLVVETAASRNVIATCPDCRSEHMGRCGGLSFRERLLSVRLDGSVTETRTKRKYYDGESLDEMFGEDESTRRERYMDETKGLGAVKREDIARLDERTLDFYTGADREEDGDAPF